MPDQDGPLSQRAMSSFALSIGTALAFESLFKGDQPAYDPTRPIPQAIDVRDYEQVWINLGTLVRNIYSSVPSASQAAMHAVDLYVTLESEVQTIRTLVSDGSFDKTQAIFYVTDDSRLAARHPHAKLRKENTPRQLGYANVRDLVLQEYLKRHSHIPGNLVFHELLTPASRKKVLILTHDAYDLLSYQAFTELHLLESHTGLLKKRTQWYSKYSDGKALMRIPFNACFMQVFGDSVHFHPFPFKERNLIKEMADQYNWTPVTTKERLKLCFELMPDVVFRSLLLDMLSE